jgi:hypothetical protein
MSSKGLNNKPKRRNTKQTTNNAKHAISQTGAISEFVIINKTQSKSPLGDLGGFYLTTFIPFHAF